MKKWFFTSESVLEGHPDKLCDQVADGILDAILEQDPLSRVACDVSASTGLIMIYGQITTNSFIDIPQIARDIILQIGYDDTDYGTRRQVLLGIDRDRRAIAI